MKKLTTLASSIFYLLLPKLSYAQAPTPIDLCPDGQFEVVCAITTGNFGTVIGTLIIVIFIIAIIIALIWLVIGGIKWITSSGDSGKVEAARNQIIAAVIGLIVVFLSFFILNFVLTVFGIEGGVTGLEIPTLVP